MKTTLIAVGALSVLFLSGPAARGEGEYEKSDAKQQGMDMTGRSVTPTVEVLNLRTEATTNSQVQGTVTQGDRLEILDTRNRWFHVRTEDGKTGWVARNYVRNSTERRMTKNQNRRTMDRMPQSDSGNQNWNTPGSSGTDNTPTSPDASESRDD